MYFEMTSYYENANDFNGLKPVDYVMTYDVKRLIEHCGHTFNDRFYFYSPSERRFYRYNDVKQKAVVMKANSKHDPISPRYRFVADDDFRDSIIVSKLFMKRVEIMKSLILKRVK